MVNCNPCRQNPALSHSLVCLCPAQKYPNYGDKFCQTTIWLNSGELTESIKFPGKRRIRGWQQLGCTLPAEPRQTPWAPPGCFYGRRVVPIGAMSIWIVLRASCCLMCTVRCDGALGIRHSPAHTDPRWCI